MPGLKFPFEEAINCVCFVCMTLEPEEQKASEFIKSKIKFLSIMKEHREIILKKKVKSAKLQAASNA